MIFDLEEERRKRESLHVLMVSFLPDLSIEYLVKTNSEIEAKELAFKAHLDVKRIEGYDTFEEFASCCEIDNVDFFLLAELIRRNGDAECKNNKVIVLYKDL